MIHNILLCKTCAAFFVTLRQQCNVWIITIFIVYFVNLVLLLLASCSFMFQVKTNKKTLIAGTSKDLRLGGMGWGSKVDAQQRVTTWTSCMRTGVFVHGGTAPTCWPIWCPQEDLIMTKRTLPQSEGVIEYLNDDETQTRSEGVVLCLCRFRACESTEWGILVLLDEVWGDRKVCYSGAWQQWGVQ